MKNDDPYKLTLFKWGKEGIIVLNNGEILGNVHTFKVATWIETNIFDKMDSHSITTEDVLMRIATGMINKLPVRTENKRFFFENLVKYRNLRREALYNSIQQSLQDLPF